MVTQIAEINIKEGANEAFEQGVAKAVPIVMQAEGCHGISLNRSVEFPLRYRVMVRWESVDHHLVKFRASEGFAQWRALVGPYFDGIPSVEHVVDVPLPQ
jgi:quinol monooxygenase YgiN